MMSQFKPYFDFDEGEKKGIFVMLVIITLLLVGNIAVKYYKFTPKANDYKSFELAINELTSTNQPADSLQQTNKTLATKLFKFNPNNLPEEQWLKLGLTPKQIKTIKKYEAKGGKFYKKEDLKKIYGIKTEDYNRLEPYIVIEENSQTNNTTKYSTHSPKTSTKKININTADSLTLIELKGIGAVLASRIVKYRNSLGGFYKLEQLLEVYGLQQETYQQILPFLELDKTLIKKININTADFKTINKHPYISYELTKQIVNSRKTKAFEKIEDLKNLSLMTEETYQQILPYVEL